MKCPYNRKSEKQITKKNHILSKKQITQYTYELMDCCKEDCAAWQDGKCGRVFIVNNVNINENNNNNFK